MACTLARRTRSEWDRPATDTRLLHSPFPNYPLPRGERARVRVIPLPVVSPSPSTLPHGRTPKPSAPSRLLPSGVISESQVPLRLPRTVDARAPARKDPTCAPRGVRMDACFDSLQMFPRLTPASAPLRRGCLPRLAAEEDPQLTLLRASPSAVDACALARMYCRTAVPGVAKIAWTAKAQAISHAPAPDAPANAAEGALATPSPLSSTLISDPSVTPAPLTRHPRPLHRHSGPRAGCKCAIGVNPSPAGGGAVGLPGFSPPGTIQSKQLRVQSTFNQRSIKTPPPTSE